jgi:predicted dehydrogenase
MLDKVRVGIVGTSWWADLMFLPPLTSYELCSVTALCGRNRERADEVAQMYGVPQVFTDYRQMIEQADIDAIFVLTSDESHYEITMAALNAGLHVFCDKPLANNAEHVKTMHETAEAKRVKHMTMYTWHWVPSLIRAKQMVDTGYIGNAFHGNIRFITGFGRGSEYAWRFDADLCNGVAADLGSHAIHLAQWLLGDVKAVSAQLGYHVPHEGREGMSLNKANDSALITLELTGGAGAQITVSSVAHTGIGERNDVLLCGEHGSIEAGWRLTETLRLSNFLRASQEGNDEVVRDEHEMDFLKFFNTESAGPRRFIDCIVNDTPAYPSFKEGYKVQQVIDAALLSHNTGCRVAIEA